MYNHNHKKNIIIHMHSTYGSYYLHGVLLVLPYMHMCTYETRTCCFSCMQSQYWYLLSASDVAELG